MSAARSSEGARTAARQGGASPANAAVRVLHVAAEVFPLLKTGGLADVVAALPVALREPGCDVRLMLPGFPALRDGLAGLETVVSLGPGFGAGRLTLLRGRLPDSDLVAYLLDAPWLYDRPGNPYLGADGLEWPDNAQRFAAFSWVAAHLAAGEFDPAWQADVLHAHDWHAGLAPAYLKMHPAPRVRSVFTIHNLAYQGSFRLSDYRELALGASMLGMDGLEFHGRGNCMKAGLVYADFLTTVSPRYATEICTPEFGCGLDGVLAARAGRLTGILNGIDLQVWNPAADPHLAARFDARRLAGKNACKKAVQNLMGLEAAANAPLATMVSRLTDQKGCDLLLAAAPELLADGLRIAVLGSGDPALERGLRAMAERFPGRLAVRTAYDEVLAHQLIAGADMILIPSRFEPCGLTQMYGHRYGTLPVAREVGGLADTVVDPIAATAARKPTGILFREPTPGALRDAVRRAVACWREPAVRDAMRRAGMAVDHSWTLPARAMRDVYTRLLAA